MVVCLHKFRTRHSWLNSWEHRGEDMYMPPTMIGLKPEAIVFAFFFCGQQHPVPGIKYFFNSLGFGR